MAKNTHELEFVQNHVIMTNTKIRTAYIIQLEPFSKALEKLLNVGCLEEIVIDNIHTM